MFKLDIEEKRILKTTAYYFGAHFSNFPLFFNSMNNFDNSQLLYVSEVERLIELSENVKNNAHVDIVSFKESGYKMTYQKIVAVLSKELSFTDWPELFLVDELPCIESGNKAWDAMAVDAQEAARLHLKEGIYFNKNCVTHGYFEFVICHELIHWMISSYSIVNPAYVPLWEEGFCDFFSVYFLHLGEVLPDAAIINLVLYNRHFKDNNSIWKRYHVYLNSVIGLALQNGVDYLYSFIKNGRTSFSNLYFYNPVTDKINPKVKMNMSDQAFLFNLLDVNSYISVKPETYILLRSLADKCNQFIDISSLSDVTALDEHQLKEAISYGFDSGLLFVEKEDVFVPNENMIHKLRFENE